MEFCYSGSILSSNTILDDELIQRLAMANLAFGRLTYRLWREHGICLRTKIKIYHIVVLTLLLYACETWMLYQCHIKQLENFHLCCLRSTYNIKWQDRIPNTEVLEGCQIPGIESMMIRTQLH
ncbi:hypothetical protein KIL84_016872 [Mauremys mutica]|uniref:Endonuclease-reverse transcriptase n=1 Tax=Mauremys mutica TaxID=74926 RepID=A0A9D3X516_9SAUR|nr:hypothetical protein KIL84_016872 [Mauremys mutica]